MPRTWRNHDRRLRQRLMLWVVVGAAVMMALAVLLVAA